MPDTSPRNTTADGVTLIAAERERQKSTDRRLRGEGWTPEHDAGHDSGDLAKAAATYALASVSLADVYTRDGDDKPVWGDFWPRRWTFKPDSKVRMLVKAGALIAAEIDRLQSAGRDADGGGT